MNLKLSQIHQMKRVTRNQKQIPPLKNPSNKTCSKEKSVQEKFSLNKISESFSQFNKPIGN
ncbi:MAG: hypothetical protein P857_95 [Candidatus Xenolissoclinum pacificiensis L6]|uniref:Uncharacterized protein n=1 Tax=Candidatus Xenolissoclinum pacificiensis L6 TaxID=1401685 RepID=W2UYR7_9RICK|nr:MAG: hypothetical protein P857_95 [Candidatus Xenolissoclinum pacificiensis L6]